MEYSKITTIEVINFMSVKHAKIMFDEQGIINIKGYNHSGKSGFLRAVCTCLMNIKPNSQAKFISHGEEYFRIIVSFDDDVVIVRDKYINGQSLYEMYKNKELVFTTKQGNKFTKVTDVPKVIKDYLGLIEIENSANGYLNYQTRKDPLWLIETKGSENYYSLNEVLRTEEIARANTLLNSDKNKLNSEIAEIESDLQNSKMLLENFESISEEFILILSEKEVEVQSLLSRKNSVLQLKGILEQLESIRSVPEIDCIDSSKLSTISSLKSMVEELGKMENIPDISLVPTERLQSIQKLQETLDSLSSINTDIIGLDISKIDISKYPPLGRLQNELKSYITCIKTLNNLKKENKELLSEKSKIVASAEKKGIKFVECSNCGTLLEVSE